jgi:hypothetical protein
MCVCMYMHVCVCVCVCVREVGLNIAIEMMLVGVRGEV